MIPKAAYDILINLLPMIILFTVVMILYRIICCLYAHEKILIHRDIKYLLYIIYIFLLFVLVTTNDFESYSNNFIPFKEILRYKTTSVLFYRNVIGNILLFIPLGFLVTDVIRDKTKKDNIFISLLICLITSATIEIIQMFIGRSFDIDDIILNFAGGLIGYIVYKLFMLIAKIIPDNLKTNFTKTIVSLLIVSLFVLIFLISYGVL